jgi:hypothetical protein
MSFPKHEDNNGGKRKKKPAQPQPQVQAASSQANGLDTELLSLSLEDLNESVGKIAHSLKSYNVNSCDGNNSLNLFTGVNSHPMRLVLEGDAVDKIADALSRIADVMEKRAMG